MFRLMKYFLIKIIKLLPFNLIVFFIVVNPQLKKKSFNSHTLEITYQHSSSFSPALIYIWNSNLNFFLSIQNIMTVHLKYNLKIILLQSSSNKNSEVTLVFCNVITFRKNNSVLHCSERKIQSFHCQVELINSRVSNKETLHWMKSLKKIELFYRNLWMIWLFLRDHVLLLSFKKLSSISITMLFKSHLSAWLKAIGSSGK